MNTADVDPTTTPQAETAPTRLAVGSWVLYDLANTIFSLGIISLYLPVWVVGVMGGTDTNHATALIASTIVILIASPLLGALSDQATRRMPFLITSTLICVGCTLLFGTGGLLPTLVLFSIANIAFLAGLQFYDALLPEVSTEENRGKISGIGVGVGYMGSIVAIIMGMLIIGSTEGVAEAEASARYVTTFRAIAIGFLLFALPCFLFVRERPRHERTFSLASVGAAARQVGSTFRSLGDFPGLGRFLIGRVFYTDAINTVIAFMGIYITAEVGFSETELNGVLGLSIVASVIGGLLWSQVVDRWGPKRTLDVVLFMWMVVFAVVAAVGLFGLPGWLMWGVGALLGIALAGTWTADRPYMLRLTPPDRVGEFYGLYGMVGRFSAVTGLALWAIIVDMLGWGRPFAVLTLLVGIVISYIILRGVSDERRTWDGSQVVE